MSARTILTALAILAVAGCGDSGGSAPDAGGVGSADTQDTATDEPDGADVAEDVGPDPDPDVAADTADTADEPDVPPPGPTSPEFTAYLERPSESVLPADVASCAVIADEACVDGTTHTCELYDTSAGGWAEDVPPMTLQAFWFDRFYDRYHQVNGQSFDIDFTGPQLAGTPESEWSQPEAFRKYDGVGDASGWTGTALFGAAARYAVTGTEADYERMLGKVEAMAFLYEVTSIPGMLARSHWAMLPDGAPEPHGHWGKAIQGYRPPVDGHFNWPIDASLLPRLPAYYTEGVEIDGTHYPTTPMIQSDASRDMYVRSMPGVLLAYDMLGEGEREDAVRAVLQTELPCTINRMKKGRIHNLQANPDILEAVTTYFAGDTVTLDEGDVDFTALDELVFFILEQPHPDTPELFDPTCPDGPPTDFDPELEYDAGDPLFILDLATLAQRETGVGDVPIAWSQHVTIRGADTLFMTQWALTAHYMTGDPAYLTWVEDLMAEIDYWGALNTYAAFQLPRWCAPHFAPSISYPSLYNVQARVSAEDHPDYWTKLATVAHVEARLKENEQREDSYFGVLYHRMVDPSVDPTRDAFVAEAVARLETYGMNPDDKLEPDRSYPRNYVDFPDPDVQLEEIAPGDPEWTICEEPIDVLGIEVPPPEIDGIPIRSVDPLPLPKRIGGTLLWQMDPWMVKREYGGVGMDTQWPMLGMFTPYWVGRADGVITEGQGLALGWRPGPDPCSEPPTE